MSHEILLEKLSLYGVSGTELRWFSCYLRGRAQYVSMSGVQSNRLPVARGVAQGSIIGPLLFSLFVNDLVKSVYSSKIVQYADDTSLTIVGGNLDDLLINVNLEISRVTYWFKSNDLVLNSTNSNLTSKCTALQC